MTKKINHITNVNLSGLAGAVKSGDERAQTFAFLKILLPSFIFGGLFCVFVHLAVFRHIPPTFLVMPQIMCFSVMGLFFFPDMFKTMTMNIVFNKTEFLKFWILISLLAVIAIRVEMKEEEKNSRNKAKIELAKKGVKEIPRPVTKTGINKILINRDEFVSQYSKYQLVMMFYMLVLIVASRTMMKGGTAVTYYSFAFDVKESFNSHNFAIPEQYRTFKTAIRREWSTLHSYITFLPIRARLNIGLVSAESAPLFDDVHYDFFKLPNGPYLTEKEELETAEADQISSDEALKNWVAEHIATTNMDLIENEDPDFNNDPIYINPAQKIAIESSRMAFYDDLIIYSLLFLSFSGVLVWKY